MELLKFLFKPVKLPNFGVFDFVRLIIRRYKEERCSQMAASLTFTTLLSLVPLFTIALTLFSAVPVFEDFSTHIKNFVQSNMLPETGGRMITRYVEQFAESASRLTAVGLVFLGLTAMLMMQTIDNAFNTIWHVTRQRSVIQRVLVYWAVLTLAPLLVGGSLSATSWLVGLSVGYTKNIPAIGVDALKIIPVILTTAAFTLLFRVVPNRFVPMRHAVIGGLVAATAFETMNQVFAYYISHFPTYKLVYGAFASVPIFLLWIYFSWLTVLFGALIAASLSHWRAHMSHKLNPVSRMYYAVRALKLMRNGMKTSEVMTLPKLSHQLHLGYDEVENILDKMSQANMVRKLSGQGWSMIRDPEHIRLGELSHLFGLDMVGVPKQQDDADIRRWFAWAEQHLAAPKKMTLQELWDNAAATRT